VFNHSPGSIQARWETLSVKQDSCLWWRVRGKDTAPNAPNAEERDDDEDGRRSAEAVWGRAARALGPA
jgi:hypothetical protein